MTPELSAKLALYRQKCASNTITREELREAIEALRMARSGAATAARSNARAKAVGATPAINANEILKGLGEMKGGVKK
jgi:hypothetical protein